MTVDQPSWHIKSTITPAFVFSHWLLPSPGTFHLTPAMRSILIILLKIATASNSHSWILLACSNFPLCFFAPHPTTHSKMYSTVVFIVFFLLELLLPNQFSKANLLTLGLWGRKEQHLLQPPSKESRQTANAQKPETPWWISGKCF